MKDYHDKVNERRKVIAEKAKKKRAIEAEQQANEIDNALAGKNSPKPVTSGQAPRPQFGASKKKTVKKITSGNDEGDEDDMEEVEVTDDEDLGRGNEDGPHWRDAEGPTDIDPDGGEPEQEEAQG